MGPGYDTETTGVCMKCRPGRLPIIGHRQQRQSQTGCGVRRRLLGPDDVRQPHRSLPALPAGPARHAGRGLGADHQHLLHQRKDRRVARRRVRGEHCRAMREVLEALPLATPEFVRLTNHLQNAERYLRSDEHGAAAYELNLLHGVLRTARPTFVLSESAR